ncbi:MAG: glycosyltransferase [Candidatus Eisenbacteria bacterium]|uniref:Glycosyltransferase n=1 Tax=Eiseniibacteriota bacterium TaxID=2212470 RepID=A0A849SH36_UNCEI|nr:glycosyltransferase [Candidatus Eisenbacteria bacterium]
MKVLHVVESMRRGGAETVVVEHVRHAAPDIESHVVALNLDGPALEAARAAGAHTTVLGKGGARLEGVRRLVALVRAARPDVINGHNATGGLYATLAAALTGVPVCFRTEHTLHFRGRHSVFYPLLEPLATAFTRRVVCVCQAVLESHVSRLPWMARRFVTVANGIASAPHTRPREEARRELGLDPDSVALLTIGSLSRQKAQHVMVEAFARVAATRPAAVLWIAGDGSRRAALEAQAAARNVSERVRFLGPREDAADLLEACDVFLLSSEREGLPMTILEAMRAARPVVSTRVGGTPEAVVDGETGRLVPIGDAEALAGAIDELVGDPARRAAFGAAARQRWQLRFTAERMVRETESLYRVALAEAAPARRVA